MPKKKRQDSQEQQSERFRKAVGDLVDAGELNLTEAAAAMEKIMATGAKKRPESGESGQDS